MGVVLTIGLLQVLPIGRQTNPVTPVEHRFDRHLQVTAEVDKLLDRACMDCHSNETRWPWYSRVAPVKWMVARDVEKGRKVMNLSEWSQRSGRRPELAASMLMSACATAKAGRMPRFPYAILHPE
ncbi:MAG TPA: heme-binding domain-containing protein, partial [Bryobacteraceae bacterium]|nr:heme-binding domain-containing protein [Bryobacteraceae bacterium]